MQEKSSGNFTKESQSFVNLLGQARKGNKKALENILVFFKDDIYSLCKYISMPREEAVQELYAELIKIILKENS